jgi:hypothetical protein
MGHPDLEAGLHLGSNGSGFRQLGIPIAMALEE